MTQPSALWSSSKTLKVVERLRTHIRIIETHGPEIARRAASPGPSPDGYGTGESDTAGVAGGGVSDPTFAAATADGGADVVADLWAEASAQMRLALEAITAASRATSRALDLGESGRGRKVLSDPCAVCLIEGASRRGMGGACYAAWQRADKPELVAWEDTDGNDRLKWSGIDPARLTGEARPGRRAG